MKGTAGLGQSEILEPAKDRKEEWTKARWAELTFGAGVPAAGGQLDGPDDFLPLLVGQRAVRVRNHFLQLLFQRSRFLQIVFRQKSGSHQLTDAGR